MLSKKVKNKKKSNRVSTLSKSESARFSGIGSPERLSLTLRYFDKYSFSGSWNPNAQVFAINNWYDPDYAIGGHQPLEYDQYAPLYSKYLVEGGRIKLQFINAGSPAIRGVITFSGSDISSRTVDQLLETKHAFEFFISSNTGGKPIVTFKRKYSVKEIMGQSGLDTDPNLYSATNSSPADLVYCIVKLAAVDGASSVSVQLAATIDMSGHFKDHLDPAQSTSVLEREVKQVSNPDPLPTKSAPVKGVLTPRSR